LVEFLVGAEELGSGAIAEGLGVDGVAVKIVYDHDVSFSRAGDYGEGAGLIRVEEAGASRDGSDGSIGEVGCFAVGDWSQRGEIIVVGGGDWLGLGTALALPFLVKVSKGSGHGFGKMASDVVVGQAGPSGEMVVPDGLREGGDDWGEQTPMEELHLVADGGGCGGQVDVWRRSWRKGNSPETVVVTGASEDGLVGFRNDDVVAREEGLAAVVAEEANGNESVLGKAREDVGGASGVGEAGKVQLACVAGADGVAVGHLDVDGSSSRFFVEARAGD
jgi:hypothetical protein